jgi:hypothetical protein
MMGLVTVDPETKEKRNTRARNQGVGGGVASCCSLLLCITSCGAMVVTGNVPAVVSLIAMCVLASSCLFSVYTTTLTNSMTGQNPSFSTFLNSIGLIPTLIQGTIN